MKEIVDRFSHVKIKNTQFEKENISTIAPLVCKQSLQLIRKRWAPPHWKNELWFQVGDSEEEAHSGQNTSGTAWSPWRWETSTWKQGEAARHFSGWQGAKRACVCVDRLLFHWRVRVSVHLSLVLQPYGDCKPQRRRRAWRTGAAPCRCAQLRTCGWWACWPHLTHHSAFPSVSAY